MMIGSVTRSSENTVRILSCRSRPMPRHSASSVHAICTAVRPKPYFKKNPLPERLS